MKRRNVCMVTLAALMVAVSCSVVDFFEKRSEPVDVAGDLPHGMIVLGEQLEDPYSVENITAALQSLYPTRARTDVRPTDLYVRFRLYEEQDFDILEEAGVMLLDHPLDYRIVREGDYYHDPEIPEDEITW